MSSTTYWRKHRQRRMVFGVVVIVVLVLLLVLAVRACGSRTDPTAEVSTGDGLPEATRQDSDAEAGNEQQEPLPYTAIEPSADAEPLSQTISDEQDAEALRMENAALGGASGDQYEQTTGPESDERSVPLGTTLLSGVEDPSDGPLKNNRIVAYYGTPLSNLMGVLGEAGPAKTMRQLEDQTREYSEADPERPAIPAIELIATIAQSEPGANGLYVSTPDTQVLDEYSELAKENDALLILDVQLGGASVMDEVRLLEEYLKKPYVHLAIDTEYSVEPGQVPGQDLGSVDGSEIQEAVRYLDDLVEEEGIPDKMLMVHEFQQQIVTNKQEIRPTGNVEIALHADGFGTPEDKYAKYGILVRDEPIQYGGFKVFYTQDTPVLEPDQVLALDPAPAIVTYQ